MLTWSNDISSLLITLLTIDDCYFECTPKSCQTPLRNLVLNFDKSMNKYDLQRF